MAKNPETDQRSVDRDGKRTSPLDLAVSARDMDVIAIVREAVMHDQAMLAYQPVVLAEDPSRTAFYKGLLRVLDPTGRVVPAREFVAQVENQDLGRELDRVALSLGCKAFSTNPSLRLAINMSARSIGYSRWQNTLDMWLSKDASIAPRLILEINEESAVLVPELVVDFMDRLQMYGICFALDDFGAGQTALRHFRDFLFDIVKIDGQFVRGIADNPDNLMLVHLLTMIGKQFEMVVVAEMVETEADAQVLTKLGVDCLQGFYFGAPTTRPSWMPGAQPRRARA